MKDEDEHQVEKRSVDNETCPAEVSGPVPKKCSRELTECGAHPGDVRLHVVRQLRKLIEQVRALLLDVEDPTLLHLGGDRGRVQTEDR